MYNDFEIKRKKIIKRIIKHSEIFSFSYLNEKTLEELETLQNEILIKLLVKMEYNMRHSKLNKHRSIQLIFMSFCIFYFLL